MQEQVIRAGQQAINLAFVSGAKWEGERLFVYLSGGRFMSFQGNEAKSIWQAISAAAIDVVTGEISAAR